MAEVENEKERITPRTEKECREVVRNYKEAVAQRIHCPFCEKDVAINKFGVHCVGKHQMNDEKLMKALDGGKQPAILSKLLEFRALSRVANAAKAALYRRDNLGKPIGERRQYRRRGSRLPVKVARAPEQIHIEQPDTQTMMQEISEQARAATTLQKAAAMVTFATLMERHGPESISALLNGMAAVDKLPRRRA